MPGVTIRKLDWEDQALGSVDLPKKKLKLLSGFGSGLSRRRGDPADIVWAISDRGPNLKLKDARKTYGWEAPGDVADLPGAKLMPRPDIGPEIAQLRIAGDRVELLKAIRLRGSDGEPVSGLPIPAGDAEEVEPGIDLEGRILPPDPSGMDTEGLTALSDGSFWVSEEYGPSLVRVDANGEVKLRLVPEGVALTAARYPVEARLPAIAARRQLNRGFEAVAASPSEAKLFAVFQSPLAHPDEDAHKNARHVRLWQLDAQGRFEAQYLYRLDTPGSFKRDAGKGEVEKKDLKLCEIVAVSETRLLVLERATETSKVYAVELDPALRLGPEHLDVGTRPTIEELSGDDAALPELEKTLLFSSDDHAEMSADMEGMVMLDDRTLLLVSDNDFGVEGKATGFYRLRFETALNP